MKLGSMCGPNRCFRSLGMKTTIPRRKNKETGAAKRHKLLHQMADEIEVLLLTACDHLMTSSTTVIHEVCM